MKVSTKTQYGLRILLHIAIKGQKNKLAQGREIATRQGINEPYLEQIMIVLKNAGMVATVRGRNGGYQLARKPEEITVLDLIKIFEGPIDLCENEAPEIPEAQASREIWNLVSTAILDATQHVTLSQIIEDHLRQGPEYMI